MSELDALRRRFERERAARKEAETLLEKKTREVYHANETLREMADRLREQADLYKAIFETAAEGIICYNEQGTIESINRSALRIFRIESAIGIDVRTVFQDQATNFLLPETTAPAAFGADADDADADDADADDADADGADADVWSPFDELEPIEVIGLRSDGETFRAEVTVSRLTRRDSTSFTMVMRDMSRRKRLGRGSRRPERWSRSDNLRPALHTRSTRRFNSWVTIFGFSKGHSTTWETCSNCFSVSETRLRRANRRANCFAPSTSSPNLPICRSCGRSFRQRSRSRSMASIALLESSRR